MNILIGLVKTYGLTAYKSLISKGKTLFLGLILMGISLSVGAEAVAALVYQIEGLKVTILSSPCSDPTVLSLVKEEFRSIMQAANVVFQDQFLNACWTYDMVNNVVVIVDQTGDSGSIPLEAFQPVDKM